MASRRPMQPRRKSIGTLEVAETKTLQHPTWSKNTTEPNIDRLTSVEHKTENTMDSISPQGHLFVPRHDKQRSRDSDTRDENVNDDNNHLDINKTLKEKNEVQFRQQMSCISNLSQITLNLSCKEKYLSWRYVIATLLHVAFFVAIFLRNCMPIALVCMTDPAPSQHPLGPDDNDSYSRGTSGNESYKEYEFHWDLNTQSLILSGVQFSSCLGPLLCDMLRVKIGSKHTMTVCTLLAAVMTFLSPVGARISPWVLFALRVLLGIFLGANVSTTADLLSWWAPASEKQTMTSFVFAGVNIGGIITSLVAGFLCSVPLDNGWPFIFYVFGFLALLITVGWHLLNANMPETHPYISESECYFIMNYRTPIDMGPKGKPEKPPYKKIFTSVPVLCFLASSSSQVWTTSFYTTVLPNFFVTVHKFTVEEAGLIMSLVSAARFLGIPIWTILINGLRKRNHPNTRTKKIILGTGYSISAITQIVILFLDFEYRWVVVGLFLVVLACQVSGMCVFTVMPMDMAPRYAGFLSGLFYSIGSLISISGPLMVAALAPNSTREEWRIIWIIVAALFAITIGIFVIFGDASVQPWARVHRDSRPNIQSAFVSMGRRISAVLDGPISTNKNPAVRGSRTFSFSGPSNGISMAPSGSGHSITYHEADCIVSTINDQNSSPRKAHYESNGHHTPREGLANPGFVHDKQEDEPGMVDKVTIQATLSTIKETESDFLEELSRKEQLKYIDDDVNTCKKDADQQNTRL